MATLTGERQPRIVAQALTALRNLDHRGAAGAETNSGDGAGHPDPGARRVPARGHRGRRLRAARRRTRTPSAPAFLPGDEEQVAKTRRRIEELADEEGLTVLGWRDVPIDPELLGATARWRDADLQPAVRGRRRPAGRPGMALERRAFCLRKRAEQETDVYFPSLSSRTLVYKGMLTTDQLDSFFPDLVDERVASALAVVHSRFSTNTFPSWPLAHPFRFIAHNGEINTVMGNRNWMRAREALLASDLIPGDLDRLFPICTPGASDSASFDEVLELLHLGGRSLPHSVLMMIPEAWENHTEMDAERRAVLRVPLGADGAVGRPRLRRLHRRLPDRRGPRPQRPAPVALLGDRRRARRARLRGRRARPRPRHHRPQGPAASRAGCSWSTPTSTGSSRTTRSRPSSPPSTRTTSGCTPA